MDARGEVVTARGPWDRPGMVAMAGGLRDLIGALPSCCFPPFALGEKCDAPATRGEWNVGNNEELLFCDVHGALNPDARDLPYAVELRAAMALLEPKE